MRDEKFSMTFSTNVGVLHYTYDRGSLLFKNVFVYVYIHHVTCIFIIKIEHISLDFTKLLVYRGFVRACCERTWSVVYDERCTPWGSHAHIIKTNPAIRGPIHST